jgi:ATP-dependent DNA helicase UvrD/PcrA
VDPLDGLNPEQRRAAETVRGPVCILAGAGSGKTTTITRRIAWQVASGAFLPEQLLAVTFTDRAAGELKARLRALGVAGVEARTFHSAALAQLRRIRPEAVGRILPTKALLLRQIANTLPVPFRFRPAADLASEIERAKANRVRPEAYLHALGDHQPPIPPDLMHRVYREYERRKDARGELDFEDLLERTIAMFEEDADARERIRARFAAFTVDEYQDVNALQQALLDLWLGPRDELCAVGDDYQAIYAFTGASPRWLLGMASRFPSAAVIRLEENYRSTPEVLELANRLVPNLQGAAKVLRPTAEPGLPPAAQGFATEADEDAWLVDELRRLAGAGLPLEELAILCRTNARLADFEEVLHEAGLPFQGSSLLGREAARRLLRQLERAGGTDVGAQVRALALDAGWLPNPPDKLGEREQTRQADLGRLVHLAEAFDDGARSGAEFVADLRRRFDPGGEGARGVQLLTYHRAKGLEFAAVFLPRLNDKELPSRLARTDDERAEERRLLYVGITRAKRLVALSWSGKPSPFVAELGLRSPARAKPAAAPLPEADGELYTALAGWRLERARADEVPPYVVFHNRVLAEIAGRRPSSHAALAQIAGVGPAKLERYGDEVLAVIAAA